MRTTNFLHMQDDDNATFRCEYVSDNLYKIQTGHWLHLAGQEPMFVSDGITIFVNGKQLQALFDTIQYHAADLDRSATQEQK